MAEEIKDGMRLEYGSPVYRHRGYDIHFRDNSETWSCHRLNLEHEKLSVVKEKINTLDKKARDLGEGIPVITVSEYGTVGMQEAKAISIDVNREDVWVLTMVPDYGSGRFNRAVKIVEARRKEKLKELILDTPEARSAIQAWLDAEKEALRVAREMRAFLKGLPRLTIPEIASLEQLAEEPKPTVRKRSR